MTQVLSANIKCNPKMPQAHVEHDIKKAKGSGATVFLWQEISIARYKQAVVKQLPASTYAHYHLDTETPISVDKRHWEVISFGKNETHGGLAAVTPNRFFTWVVVQNKGGNARLVFINTHTVSGAFTHKKKYNLTRNYRVSRWNYHFAMLGLLTQRFNMLGYTVILGGDWNRTTLPNLTPVTKNLTRNNSLDHIIVSEANNGIKVDYVAQDAQGGYYTDHHPLLSTYRMYKDKNYVAATALPRTYDLMSWRSGKSQPKLPAMNWMQTTPFHTTSRNPIKLHK